MCTYVLHDNDDTLQRKTGEWQDSVPSSQLPVAADYDSHV